MDPKDGAKALWIASSNGDTLQVRQLLEAGVPINALLNGETALAGAIQYRRFQMATFLLDNGADPHAPGRGGSPLTLAANAGLIELVQRMLARSSGPLEPKVLRWPACCGPIDVMKLLLAAGAEPEGGGDGIRPLIVAAEAGRLTAVQILLDAGAAVDSRSDSGETALHAAARGGHVAVLTLLLDRGANVNDTGPSARSPLMAACENGREQAALTLVQRGARLNDIDPETGSTALGLAAQTSLHTLERELLSRGAKERAIKRPQAGTVLSILECDICAYLPHRRELDQSTTPRDTPDLRVIWIKTTYPDNYTTATRMLKQCEACGAYYQHDHSIDTEDSVATPPTIHHSFERLNLLFLRDTLLPELGKTTEASALAERLPSIVVTLTQALAWDRPITVTRHVLPHLVESVIDNHCLNQDWIALFELLNHPVPNVAALAIADVLALKNTYPAVFPSMKRPAVPTVSRALGIWFAGNKPLVSQAITNLIQTNHATALTLEFAARRDKLL